MGISLKLGVVGVVVVAPTPGVVEMVSLERGRMGIPDRGSVGLSDVRG